VRPDQANVGFERKDLMPATEILTHEHRVIEQVLTCLEQMTAGGIARGRLDGASAHEAIEFFEAFLDRSHHAKEEQGLLPLLEARGFPVRAGPTGAMQAEYKDAQLHLRGMAAETDPAAAGDGVAMLRFARDAREYARVIREHIAKEDLRLLPMADLVLTDGDQAQLLTAFERVEHSRLHPGAHQKYLRIADELADRFDVAKAAAPAAERFCCATC
jgi:hemerythrin-like domain-containing protein